eukprot:scaffold221841_cov28-Tisochrysis_lutea.AAC.5
MEAPPLTPHTIKMASMLLAAAVRDSHGRCTHITYFSDANGGCANAPSPSTMRTIKVSEE